MRLRSWVLALGVGGSAHADTLTVTPYLHGNFGDVEIRRGGPGIALGYRHRWLGVELDADRHHHYYKDDVLTSVPNACVPGVMGPCIDSNTDAWIFSASAIGYAPIARDTRWRFYGSAGGGLIYAWIHGAGEYNSDQLLATASLGIGASFWAKPWLGFRLDARYFHAFVDEANPDGGYARDFDYGRLALGVVFAPLSL
jgi:hypothetical protein